MKKKLALVLTLAMVFSLAPLSAYADAKNTITTANGTATHDVTATYVAGSSGGAGTKVYSVDIVWGDMAFTYTEEAGVWNPATHETTGANGGIWKATSPDGNKIKVTNHSNAAVTATFSYAAATGYGDISGSFDKTTLNLATAVDTLVSNAPSDSAELTLDGALASSTPANTTIGTITVTLS